MQITLRRAKELHHFLQHFVRHHPTRHRGVCLPVLFSMISMNLLGLTVSSGVAFFLTLLRLLTRQTYDSRDGFVPNRVFVDSEYDFIVVGAGAAGSVLANRLSEIKNWSVLLLEAGTEESIISQMPAFSPLLANSDYDWKYRSEISPDFCLSLIGRRCHMIQGKGMGGGTMLNYMLHTRGNRRDYDMWESMGNPGWGYRDVLPYFLKSEDNWDFPPSEYHSRGGFLPAKQVDFQTPLADLFLRAGEELGYQVVDVNGERQTGFAKPQVNSLFGERFSNSRAFLRPVRNRRNLHVAKMAHVHRVVFESGISRKAKGVIFRRHGRFQTVRARKEVILSAGALSTPKILMLSGVGPSWHLHQMGIKVIKNLTGVGGNLQDHIGCGGLNYLINHPYALNAENLLTAQTIMEWLMKRAGPITLPGGIEGLAFINTRNANVTDDYPDVEFHFAPSSVGTTNGILARAHGLSPEVLKSVYEKMRGLHSWTIIPVILRPKSRGHLKLRSLNAEEPPYIFLNYLQHPEDTLVLVEASKMVHQLSQTKAFQSVGSQFWKVPLPGCKGIKMFTDTHWECHLRHYTNTVYHPSGTCKMGPRSDHEAVVDNRLRVHGVKGLRVADTSIMPTLVSGNTAVPATMIGEKTADFVKEDWGQKPFCN